MPPTLRTARTGLRSGTNHKLRAREVLSHAASTISPGQKAAGSGPGSGRSGPRSGPPQRAYLSTVPLALARSRCWKRPWAWGSRKASRQPGALTETSQSGLSDAACDALQAETAGTWLLLLPHGAPDQGETRAAVTLMAPALDRAPAGGRAEA